MINKPKMLNLINLFEMYIRTEIYLPMLEKIFKG